MTLLLFVMFHMEQMFYRGNDDSITKVHRAVKGKILAARTDLSRR